MCLPGPGSRLICRSERPHPGAQFQIFDEHGYRYTCFLTDQDGTDIVQLELRHRGRARVKDSIRVGPQHQAKPAASLRARRVGPHRRAVTQHVGWDSQVGADAVPRWMRSDSCALGGRRLVLIAAAPSGLAPIGRDTICLPKRRQSNAKSANPRAHASSSVGAGFAAVSSDKPRRSRIIRSVRPPVSTSRRSSSTHTTSRAVPTSRKVPRPCRCAWARDQAGIRIGAWSARVPPARRLEHASSSWGSRRGR